MITGKNKIVKYDTPLQSIDTDCCRFVSFGWLTPLVRNIKKQGYMSNNDIFQVSKEM